MVNIFRLGKRDADSDTPRPIMIQLASYSIKNLIMQSLFKLKSADQIFKGIIIARDMTVSERQECKRLVEEAKKLSSQDTLGEFVYRVQGLPGEMKITKFRVRN